MSESLPSKGGSRPGAGRPSDKHKYEVAKKLEPLEKKWLAGMALGLEAGDSAWGRIYAEYRWGRPLQRMDLTSNNEKLTTISVQVIQGILPTTPAIENTTDIDYTDMNGVEDQD